MTAEEIIKELEALPPQERVKVREFLDEIAPPDIPQSFWDGLREADEGRLIDMEDSHFENPPA